MSDAEVQIGRIAAVVALNLQELATDVASAKQQITDLATTMSEQIAEASQQTAAQLEHAAQQAGQAAQAQMTQALSMIGSQMEQMGQQIESGLKSLVQSGANFETMLSTIANNTTMTAADVTKMTETVKAMGRESGAPLEELAQGFMHVTNFGYSAAQSQVILREAMKGAVATGAGVGSTADILAKVMHEFGIKTGDAAKAMNVLHLAAAQGDMTLEQFNHAAGPAFALAASVGVSLTDAAAGMSAFTRNGFNASQAATQFTNILTHMLHPSAGAAKELARLSKETGIDLVGDFTLAGLKAKDFSGVMEDLRKATGGNAQEIFKLIAAQRGGIGAMVITGKGTKDYKDILLELTDAISGKVDTVTQLYEKQLGTLNQQMGKNRNEVILLGAEIEKDLLPYLKELGEMVLNTIKWFEDLDPTTRKVIEGVAGFGAASLIAIGGTMKFVAAVRMMKTGFDAIVKGAPVVIDAIKAIGVAAETTAGMVAISLGAITAGLAVAYKINEEMKAAIEKGNKDAWDAATARRDPHTYQGMGIEALKAKIAADQKSLSGFSYSPAAQYDMKKQIEAEVQGLKELTAERQKAADAAKSALPNLPPIPAMPGAGGGHGGAGGESSAKQRLKEIKDAAEDAAKALEDAKEKLFELTHTDAQNQAHQALKELHDNLGNHVPQPLALQVYNAELKQIAANAEQATRAVQDEIFAMGHSTYDVQRKDVGRERDEQVKSGADPGRVAQLYKLKMDAINNEERKALAQWVGNIDQAVEAGSGSLNKLFDAWHKKQVQNEQEISEARRKGLEEQERAESESDRAIEELERNRYVFEAEQGGAALDRYLEYLQKRLDGTIAYSNEWMQIMREMISAQKALDDEIYKKATNNNKGWGNQDSDEEQGPSSQKFFEQMVGGMVGTLQSSIGDLFDKGGGTKKFFADVLKGWAQMLEKMVAMWIEKMAFLGIAKLIGGPIGDLISDSIGGFDDAGNDRKAVHWGSDFMDMFSRGMDFSLQTRAAGRGGGADASAASGASHSHINVNIDNVHVHNDSDYSRVGERIAWHTQQQLRAKVGS